MDVSGRREQGVLKRLDPCTPHSPYITLSSSAGEWSITWSFTPLYPHLLKHTVFSCALHLRIRSATLPSVSIASPDCPVVSTDVSVTGWHLREPIDWFKEKSRDLFERPDRSFVAFSQFKMSVLPYAQEAKEQIRFCGDISKTEQPNFHLIPVKLASGLQFMSHFLKI